MKKILFSAVALAAFTFNVHAQEKSSTYGFSKGDILVEGNLRYSSEDDKNDEIKQSNFNFSPKAGYMITDDIAVGLQLGFGSDKSDYYGADEINKYNTFQAGVFGRYYFLNLGERFKVYGEAGLGLSNGKYIEEFRGVETSVKNKGAYANAGIGVNYFVTERFAINFGLSDVISYRTSKLDVSGAEAVNNFDANINVFNNFFSTATFGLTYKF